MLPTGSSRRGVALLLAAAAAVLASVVALAAPPTDPQAPTAADAPLQIMRVPQALDRIGRPLQDVVVHVPDTGLDLKHPDLQSRLFSLPQATSVPDPNGGPDGLVAAGAPGWDFIGTLQPPPGGGNPTPDADPSDTDGHGTAVAGMLGAAWDNGQGAAGVAPNARFLALRTCWPADQCYENVQAVANTWAAQRGARVVSMSWLTGAPIEAGFRDSITGATNTLFVAIPSGNGGATNADPDAANRLPCSLNSANVLCVTTSSPTDGLDCGDYGATLVDVAVPTQKGITTINGGTFGPTGCATSYAAPAAAGVATILFGLDPAATPAEVKSAIIDSARKVPAWAGRSVSGGIVDAEAAVVLFSQRRNIPLRAVAPPPPPPPPPGSGTGTGTGTGSGTGGTTNPTAAQSRAQTGSGPPQAATPRRPSVSGVALTLARGRVPALRAAALIVANGAATTWAIERRTVRRTPKGRRVTTYVVLKAGSLRATGQAAVSATLRGRGAFTVRVVARNRVGTTTSRLVTASLPA